MKKSPFLIMALTATLAAASHAETVNLAKDFYPHGYMGFNLGKASVSSNNGIQDFSFVTAGLSGGYQFTDIFAAEALVIVTVSSKTGKGASFINETDIDTDYTGYGAYLTAKSKGPFYVKGRLGLANSTITYSASGYEDEKGSDFGLSYGIGAGFSKGKYSYELEYTLLPDVDDPLIEGESYSAKNLSLSMIFNF